MKRFLLLLLIGCGCACTSIDNAPAPTQAGWVLFGSVNTAFGNHCEAAMRAAQLDEYRRQTTDEGRREVQDRYFLRERIVNDGNVWRVLSTGYTWRFEFRIGQYLGETGTELHVTCETLYGYEPEEKAVIRSGADQMLSMASESETMQFATTAEMKFRMRQDAEGGLSLEFFSGCGTLRGKDKPRLDIDYSIVEPVVFLWSEPFPQPGGKLDISAFNEAEGSGVHEVATARYLKGGAAEITYGGVSATWNPGEPYRWE